MTASGMVMRWSESEASRCVVDRRQGVDAGVVAETEREVVERLGTTTIPKIGLSRVAVTKYQADPGVERGAASTSFHVGRILMTRPRIVRQLGLGSRTHSPKVACPVRLHRQIVQSAGFFWLDLRSKACTFVQSFHLGFEQPWSPRIRELQLRPRLVIWREAGGG